MPAARRVRHVPSAIAVLVASAVIASIAPSARGVRPTADEADAHAGAAQRVASDLFGAISDLAHFHANARARRIAALSMGRLVPKLSELGNGRGADEALAMSALHRAVRLDPDASVRRAAFDSLAFIRRSCQTHLGEEADFLDSDWPDVRAAAVKLLGESSGTTVETLVLDALEDDDCGVQTAAYDALEARGWWRHPGELAGLTEAFSDCPALLAKHFRTLRRLLRSLPSEAWRKNHDVQQLIVSAAAAAAQTKHASVKSEALGLLLDPSSY